MALAVAVSDQVYLDNIPELPPISNVAIAERVSTHPSFNAELTQTFEFPLGGASDYRVDALRGDALLKGFLTEILYERYPQLTPGAATVILSSAWSNATLARLARQYGLPKNLRAAAHQRAGLVHNNDVASTMLEAYMYGIHLSDTGGSYTALRTFIRDLFSPLLTAERAAFAANNQAVAAQAENFTDWVSRLNLWSQRGGNRHIEYVRIGAFGPDHAPTFTIAAQVNGITNGTGTGNTLKAAKHAAAAAACVAVGA